MSIPSHAISKTARMLKTHVFLLFLVYLYSTRRSILNYLLLLILQIHLMLLLRRWLINILRCSKKLVNLDVLIIMFLSSIVFFENRSYHCRSVFVYGRHSNSLLRITTFNSADHKFRLYYEILIVVNTNLDAGWLHCTHCALRFYDTGNRSNLLLWLRNKLLLWLRQKLLLLL